MPGPPAPPIPAPGSLPRTLSRSPKTFAETGDIVTAGGRVLSVVSLGNGLDKARAKAYAAVDKVKWDGEQHRTDIAEVAARGQITVADIYPAPAEAVPGPHPSAAASR